MPECIRPWSEIPEEVALADLDTVVAQDGVGGGAVEGEVRDNGADQVTLARVGYLTGAHLQRNLLVFAAVDLRLLHAVDEIQRLRDARLQLVEGRFVIFERGHL